METELMLEVAPETLSLWLSQETTRKVMEFLRTKQAQVMKDWQEGNDPQEDLATVGVWTLTMAAQCQAYQQMLNLSEFLNPDLKPA